MVTLMRMRILPRLVPSDSELLFMSITLLEDAHGRAYRLRLKRQLQRSAYYLAVLGNGWLLGYAIALPVRLVRGLYTPTWWWFAIDLPLVFFLCALALMFHVERLYRKVGL
jgi:hypothetical protein